MRCNRAKLAALPRCVSLGFLCVGTQDRAKPGRGMDISNTGHDASPGGVSGQANFADWWSAAAAWLLSARAPPANVAFHRQQTAPARCYNAGDEPCSGTMCYFLPALAAAAAASRSGGARRCRCWQASSSPVRQPRPRGRCFASHHRLRSKIRSALICGMGDARL